MQSRVLLLVKHLANGGAERAITLWARILTDAGYQVTVLTLYPRPDEYPLDPRVNHVNLTASFEQYSQFANKSIAYKKLLEQYLAQHPQDLLIPFLFTNNFLSAICDRTNLKTVTQTIRNNPWQEEADGLKLALRDWAIQKQGSVILQNNEQAEYFNAAPFKHVKKYVVHNPLNPAIAKIKKEHYGAIKKIIAVGRLVPQKNHALMIETIRILRDEFHENYCLDIYGVGALQETLQKQIDQAQLNNQVKLCGHSSDIFPVMINYDLFLMTSFFEGTPNALLEAMGLGVPALAIQCRTGISELIDDGKNGYIMPGYDAHDLAVKIRQINNSAQLEKIGKQARQDMTRYSHEKIQTELVTMVQDLLTNPPLITDAKLKPVQNITDYQAYFEDTLQRIKPADYPLGKQIFDQAHHILQGVKIDAPSYTKKMYYDCLQTNQFDVFYAFLQDLIARTSLSTQRSN